MKKTQNEAEGVVKHSRRRRAAPEWKRGEIAHQRTNEFKTFNLQKFLIVILYFVRIKSHRQASIASQGCAAERCGCSGSGWLTVNEHAGFEGC